MQSIRRLGCHSALRRRPLALRAALSDGLLKLSSSRANIASCRPERYLSSHSFAPHPFGCFAKMVAKKIVCGLPNSQVFAFNCDADRLVRCVSGSAASARAAGSSGRVRPSAPRLPWGPPSLSIRRRYLCQPFPHGVRAGGHTKGGHSHCALSWSYSRRKLS